MIGMIKIAALSLCMLFVPLTHAEEVGSETHDYLYMTKPGDTLSKLAIQMLDEAGRWRDVARYNKLGDPDRIEIGQQLRFRQVWLRDRPKVNEPGKAKVEAITGVVRVDGNPVKVGDLLAAGASLATETGAALRMSLPDGSVMNMLEDTSLKLEKLEKLEQDQVSNFKSLLQLVTGHIEAFKKKFPAGQADLEIKSATATIGVRGTHFRMRRVEGTSFAEIEEGLVSFEADKTPQILEISGGQGSVADGVHPAEVFQLLPSPTFPEFQSAYEPVYVKLVMPELPGAQEFVGEIAGDEDFSRNVKSVRSIGNALGFLGLDNGKYWLRLRAVDVHGLQGMEGKASFLVQARPRVMEMIKTYITSGNIELRWLGHGRNARYQIQVSRDPAFATVMLDEETDENMKLVTKPDSGLYFVRVRGMSADRHADQWDAPVMFRVP